MKRTCRETYTGRDRGCLAWGQQGTETQLCANPSIYPLPVSSLLYVNYDNVDYKTTFMEIFLLDNKPVHTHHHLPWVEPCPRLTCCT